MESNLQSSPRANTITTTSSSIDIETNSAAEAQHCSTSECFQQYRKILDAKHDKYEALVKASRDLTIDSKKIIFLLHRVNSKDSKQIELLEEAGKMINNCIAKNFAKITKQLHKQDVYQMARAISPGIQEFIEAFTFYTFIKDKKLPQIEEVNHYITALIQEELKTDHTDKLCEDDGNRRLITQRDFILGIADLTGELMRWAINSISTGRAVEPLRICQVLQLLELSFNRYCANGGSEVQRKISTMRSSINKVEAACYTLKLRGSEVPNHLLADSVSTKTTTLSLSSENYK